MQHVDGLDPKPAQKVDFYARQFIDAMSPSNFLMTNPEVLRKTIESGGENLLRARRLVKPDLRLDSLARDLQVQLIRERVPRHSHPAVIFFAQSQAGRLCYAKPFLDDLSVGLLHQRRGGAGRIELRLVVLDEVEPRPGVRDLEHQVHARPQRRDRGVGEIAQVTRLPVMLHTSGEARVRPALPLDEGHHGDRVVRRRPVAPQRAQRPATHPLPSCRPRATRGKAWAGSSTGAAATSSSRSTCSTTRLSV